MTQVANEFENINFGNEQYTENTGGIIPDGQYEFVISHVQLKTGADQLERFIQLEFSITSGDFKGRKVFKALKFKNKDLKIRQKAYKFWVNLNKVVNTQIQPNDFAQFAGKVAKLWVGSFDRVYEGKKITSNFIEWKALDYVDVIAVKNTTGSAPF